MILRSFGQKISPLTKKHPISLKKFIYFFIAFNIAALSNGYSETTKETYKQLSIFNEVFNRVKERYVEEVTDKELIEKVNILMKYRKNNVEEITLISKWYRDNFFIEPNEKNIIKAFDLC